MVNDWARALLDVKLINSINCELFNVENESEVTTTYYLQKEKRNTKKRKREEMKMMMK